MNATHDDGIEALALLLANAQEANRLLPALDPAQVPVDAGQAYAVQHRILALRGQALRGWKVGAKSATGGPIQGAPLPADRVLPSPATVRRSAFATLGLELEIAFRFGRAFEPRAQPYSEAEVQGGIGSMLATIEIVSSRYHGWPAVDKLAQLADLQNHGALAVGEAIAYSADFPFESPTASLRFDDVDIVKGRPANPAGDPRRLLVWLVNHATSRGLTIGKDIVVTTGSYTGMHFPERPGTAIGEIEGLPAVRLAVA
jgi:2-keto-4-pentenoate hydratase